jgi:hypothetical protein
LRERESGRESLRERESVCVCGRKREKESGRERRRVEEREREDEMGRERWSAGEFESDRGSKTKSTYDGEQEKHTHYTLCTTHNAVYT